MLRMITCGFIISRDIYVYVNNMCVAVRVGEAGSEMQGLWDCLS